jgi:hypothetical protein
VVKHRPLAEKIWQRQRYASLVQECITNELVETCCEYSVVHMRLLYRCHVSFPIITVSLQGQQVSEATVINRIGPANFEPNDFVIFNRLGNVSVRRVSTGNVLGSADDDPFASIRVNVFAATYESGRPFEGPATVLLKEYLPGSWDVGLNELQIRASIEV